MTCMEKNEIALWPAYLFPASESHKWRIKKNTLYPVFASCSMSYASVLHVFILAPASLVTWPSADIWESGRYQVSPAPSWLGGSAGLESWGINIRNWTERERDRDFPSWWNWAECPRSSVFCTSWASLSVRISFFPEVWGDWKGSRMYQVAERQSHIKSKPI